MKRYYINWFEESRNYFMSFGFTEKEMEKLNRGEDVKRDGNTFWIVTEEEEQGYRPEHGTYDDGTDLVAWRNS